MERWAVKREGNNRFLRKWEGLGCKGQEGFQLQREGERLQL